MRLYWHPFSVFPRRVRIVLREKGIAHEEVVVDLPNGATRTETFRALSPFGQVPVLEDGGTVVFESVAILEYLEERHPRPALLPAGAAARAHARAWMQAAGADLAPAFKRWIGQFFAPDVATDLSRAHDEIAAHLDVLERPLARAEHLAGEYSLADVCYAPFVCEMAAARLTDLVAERPAVAAWIERLRARPAIRDTGFQP